MPPVLVDHEQLHPHTRLWFYALAWVDIDEAVRAARVCLHLRSKPPTQEYFDHLELCVLRYGRPFAFTNTPTGKKKTRLPPELVAFVGMDQDLHERMLKMRHSVVAHSDMGHKSMRLRVRPAGISPPSTIYECEPTWKLLTMAEVTRFRDTGGKAVECLRDACKRLLLAYGHELERDAEGWLVLAPHPDD